jgi:hypothetical protein
MRQPTIHQMRKQKSSRESQGSRKVTIRTVALKQWKQSLVSLVHHNKKSKLKKMSLRKVIHLT